jgi:trigger factor
MEVSVEDLGALRKSLKVVLPKDLVAAKIEAAYKKIKSKAAIKGFRKGKIPQKVLEKTYGEQVKGEVGEELIQGSYFDALEETKLDAVVHPDIRSHKFEDDGSFAYEAEIEIKPVFDLQEYKGVEIEHRKVAVTDEEVDKALERTRKEMAPLRSIDDRGAQENDLLIIDFQGFNEEGQEISQVAGTEYSVDIGSGRNGKEFEDMLIGLKNGEEASRTVEFPTDIANPMLAGNKINFKITVKDIKERVLADLDDDFAQDVSEEYKTLADLKASIAEKILKAKEKEEDGDITDKIMLKLLDNHDFDLPARLVAYEIHELVKELETNLERQGLNLETAGLNKEQLAEQYKEAAERRVKGEFILKKIAEKEQIKLTEEDISQGFTRISAQYGMPVEEVKKYFHNRNDMLPFMNELLSEKILTFLRKEAKVLQVDELQAENKEAGEE